MQGFNTSEATENGGTAPHGHTLGDRVWLLLRPVVAQRHGPQTRPHFGTVIGIDDGPRPGVRIELDQPALTPFCYATHDEVHKATS